ncbi:MAG TPA: NAD(P)-dependent glycerol-1-phosphate dehydrogenase [Nitrososphaerales archaeon]|nr:NAD(P)-dependent glycerol-1-phosphate dehydrogenase [Nitrososphaerales archaeon]
MPAHIMELPRRVVVGHDILKGVGRLLEGLELGKKALVLSGEHVKGVAGAALVDHLNSQGFDARWEGVESSTFQQVERASDIGRKFGADFFVGVGGGKSIDVAKLASFNCKVPFVSVPTSASHDGISSPFGSVKGLDRPYSVVAKPPIAIIADIEIILKAPHNLLISGCGDLVSKKTAVKDWQLSNLRTGEYYGMYSASLALLSANLIIDNSQLIASKDPECVRVVVEALISSGVAAGIAGSSRPCSGSEHLFSHAMDIVAPGKGLHGEKCGIGTIMMAKLHGVSFHEIRDALQTMGAPVTASQIGASPDEVVKSLVMAASIRKERYTILSEVNLTENSAKELASETGVI